MRRGLRLLISLWILVTFSFLIVHLVPGDPVRKSLGINASASLVAQTRHSLGLDDPLTTQYAHYLRDLAHGRLGTSLNSGLSVSSTIGDELPNTLLLASVSFVIVIVIAIPIGLGMAVLTRNGRRRYMELGYTTGAVLLGTVPDFFLAVALVYLFAVRTHLLPVAGEAGPSSFVLPVTALSLGAVATVSRIVRVEVLAVLGQDYIRTARAKRLRSSRVYFRHALPNAVTATLTVSGLLLAGLVAGSVLVESIFAWPGLGRQFVTSITNYDYPLVQALVLVYGGMVLCIHFAVDVLLALIDPRSTIRET